MAHFPADQFRKRLHQESEEGDFVRTMTFLSASHQTTTKPIVIGKSFVTFLFNPSHRVPTFDRSRGTRRARNCFDIVRGVASIAPNAPFSLLIEMKIRIPRLESEIESRGEE